MMKDAIKVVKRSKFVCTRCGGAVPSSFESRAGEPNLIGMELCLRCYVHIIYTDYSYTWDETDRVWYRDVEGLGQ